MEIVHNPVFKTAEVERIYSEKDGVDVKYVCTTDLVASDVPVDVFYRETPHPQFGNRYFGIYWDHVRDCSMITNADMVENDDFRFGMVVGDDDKLHYSQSHHDCQYFENGNMIDGGRVYIRSSFGGIGYFRIKDGELVEIKKN